MLKRPISLDNLPYPRPTHYLPEILSVEEVNRLMQSIPNLKHRTILQLMYSCALRVSEPTKIDVWHVDFDRKELMIKNGKYKQTKTLPHIRLGKILKELDITYQEEVIVGIFTFWQGIADV